MKKRRHSYENAYIDYWSSRMRESINRVYHEMLDHVLGSDEVGRQLKIHHDRAIMMTKIIEKEYLSDIMPNRERSSTDGNNPN